MYGTRIRTLLACLPLLAIACGDNSSPCDYTELADGTNDVTAEMTGFVLGDHTTHVCGQFDPAHFNSTIASADDDRYRVSVTGTTPILIDLLVGDGLDALTGVTIRFYDLAANATLLGQAHYDPSTADHDAFLLALPPGDYDLVVSADAPGEISAPITYRLRFAKMPACDEPKDATYAEKDDTGGANDTVAVDFTKDPSFTAMTSSKPETSGIGVTAGQTYLIEGALDDQPRSDQYLDRDTYEMSTDETTNELAVKLAWDGTASDVDYILFEADSMKPIVAANLSSDTGPELAMFAVKPSTKYWLWVGGFEGSMATSYRATVCGNHFFY